MYLASMVNFLFIIIPMQIFNSSIVAINRGIGNQKIIFWWHLLTNYLAHFISIYYLFTYIQNGVALLRNSSVFYSIIFSLGLSLIGGVIFLVLTNFDKKSKKMCRRLDDQISIVL